MTEGEAKTKWCPFAKSRSAQWHRTTIEPMQAKFLDENNDVSTGCVASDCMAWRQTSPAVSLTFDDAEKAAGNKDIHTPASGFCGLAGAPR